jgi:hypothetical protein
MLTGLAGTALGAEGPSPDVTEPPAYADFLVVPLRVHVLTAEDLADIDCELEDADIARILRKVNSIWANAGIYFGLDSLVREPAAEQAKFRLALRLDGRVPLEHHRILLPAGSRRFDGLHVYYIHRLGVNGVYMDEDFAIVQETAQLRPVEGGIDEPIPRVTAHELGHALGLRHRQDRTNLLASGTTGTRLNTDEVKRARTGARRIAGMLPVGELRQQAEDATAKKEPSRARRLWSWLSELPGPEAAEAKRRLETLDPPTTDAQNDGPGLGPRP